jgi:hypothetical protein
MATDATSGDAFLEELYGLTDGQATKVVRGEDLARKLGMDPEEEIDKARFLGDGAASRGGGVRHRQQDRSQRTRLFEPLADARGHPGGRGGSTGVGHHRRSRIFAW